MALRKAGERLKLIWFEGRATPAVAPSVEAARARGSAGSKGDVVATRSPTEDESRRIAKGEWIRARKPGSPQHSDVGNSTFRPQLHAKAKGRPVS